MKTEKTKSKKAISLIVLVITIIVMIILAAVVIVTLSSNNIIGRAEDAVNVTNLKQMQELAHVGWVEAYAGGARTKEALETAVTEYLANSGVEQAILDGDVQVVGLDYINGVFYYRQVDEYR